jgi:L-aspartate oxidase
MSSTIRHEVLVIGSGAAGLSLALRLAEAGIEVAVLSKAGLTEGSTLYAQGGISAVLAGDDTVESHVQDTLNAGAGLCEEQAVRFTVENGPASIHWLISQGVPFTQAGPEEGGFPFHLTREGGHSHRRVIHAADSTGHAVETTLESLARKHPKVRLYEHHIAVDLITGSKLGLPHGRCLGAYVFDIKAGHVQTLAAHAVVLATGGANQVYLYSSNPHAASGDGIAMAWRAGCRVANMEFMQFHPTCLFHPDARSFLITEAMRGEGAVLRLPDDAGRPGERFMHRFDPRAELAPRDIVARAIDHEIKRLGREFVYLDISHKPADFVISHFPNIYRRCMALGLDITRVPLPVVPAAHYTCGGVMTTLDGRTDVAGLYAIGETAYTGLHGANRMASNSLLECLVFGAAAADDILRQLAEPLSWPDLPPWDESRVTDSDEEVVVSHNWLELRRFMWDYVGIVRTDKRLQRAKHRIDLLRGEIHDYYENFRVSADLIELRNLALVADLIIRSAMLRRESRGLHFNLDHPQSLPNPANTILNPQTPG